MATNKRIIFVNCLKNFNVDKLQINSNHSSTEKEQKKNFFYLFQQKNFNRNKAKIFKCCLCTVDTMTIP